MATHTPSQPVYKKHGYDCVIFKHWNSYYNYGWTLGNSESLNTGSFYFTSGKNNTKPWQTGVKWTDTQHSNEVTVECLTSEENNPCQSNPCVKWTDTQHSNEVTVECLTS